MPLPAKKGSTSKNWPVSKLRSLLKQVYSSKQARTVIDGLEDEELARLFEPFYRSPASVRAPGAGLGLSVVQRIAESFGGRAWAARSASGGSDFGFALPQLSIPEE